MTATNKAPYICYGISVDNEDTTIQPVVLKSLAFCYLREIRTPYSKPYVVMAD